MLSQIAGKYPRLSEALEIVGKKAGKLYPPQAEAISKGVLDGKNILMASGTGSGKTLVAELAAVSKVLNEGRKVVYIAPLRALAGEKAEEFRKYEELGIKTALSMGNLDNKDDWLGSADIIVSTSEKFDSLMRHGAGWIGKVGLMIVDEIHEIGSGRGPTLETLVMKMRERCPNLQVVALSATVGNAGEMAGWLNAEIVESAFRPVPLFEGVYFSNTLRFAEKEKRVVSGFTAPELACLEDTLKEGFQSLIFLNTRKSAEATAERGAKVVEKFISEGEVKRLGELAKEVLGALDYPTKQCKRLADCIRKGAAFHHAGLAHRQKVAVEQAFREGLIKFLSATVTLVAGINLPARRIMIRSLSRYTSFGMEEWPVSLYKQAVGRAGRAGYDDVGESIVMCASEGDAERVRERYLEGEPENVLSRIADAPVMRSLVIGVIASGFARDRKSLELFFSKSFHAYQTGHSIIEGIDGVVDDLISWGFLEGEKRGDGFVSLGSIGEGGALKLTRTGRRVAELYLDPLSARLIIDRFTRKTDDFSSLLAICDLGELGSMPSVRRGEEEILWQALEEGKEGLLQKIPEPWDLDAKSFLKSAKMAKIFQEWIGEKGESFILEEYGVSPGDLRNKISNADWVIFGAGELARLEGREEVAKELNKLRLRVESGVREELLKLVSVKDIGRKRARKLYGAGIKSKVELKKAGLTKAASIIGPGVAKKIFSRMV